MNLTLILVSFSLFFFLSDRQGYGEWGKRPKCVFRWNGKKTTVCGHLKKDKNNDYGLDDINENINVDNLGIGNLYLTCSNKIRDLAYAAMIIINLSVGQEPHDIYKPISSLII